MDDFTRYTWVFFLIDKSDVFATFKSFIKRIHNEFETTIKKVRSDNRSEFKNTRIDESCDEFGIRHQFLAKYTPQSNGLVERKNRTLIDMARSMLSEYNVSHSFWAEAINTACYYSNRLYCHPMMEKTPYELLNGRKPNIAYFWVFGCKCYILKKDKYIKDMLKKFGMDDVKAISTPMGTNGSLDSDACGNMVDQKIYQSTIGSLLCDRIKAGCDV